MAGEVPGPGMITMANVPQPVEAPATPDAPRFAYTAEEERAFLLDGRDIMEDALPMDIARPVLRTLGIEHPDRPAPAPRPQPTKPPVYEYRSSPQIEIDPNAPRDIDDAISRDELREILQRMDQ